MCRLNSTETLNVLIFVLRLVTLTFGGLTGNIYLGLVLFMLAGVFFNGYYNYYVVKKSGGHFSSILKSVRKYLSVSVIALATTIIIQLVNLPAVAIFVVCCLIGIGYEAVLFKKNKEIKQYFIK